MTNWKKIGMVLIFGTFFSARALATSSSESAFGKITALAGTWTTADGSSKITYQVVSNGSVIMETSGGMITMYHLDGENLLATHYCSIGNQPRMRATKFEDPKVISFDFLDITNLKPGGGHISAVKFTWKDETHLTEDWTYVDGHGGSGHETFDLVRAAK